MYMYIVHVDYIILMIGTNLAMPLLTAVMALVTQLLFVVRNEVVVTIVPCVVSVTLLSRSGRFDVSPQHQLKTLHKR